MRKVAFVIAGGFCGTLARYLLSAPLQALASGLLPSGLLPGAPGGFPYDILAVNLSGAIAMGLLYGLVEHGAAIPPEARLALGTGFLGAYTTFSSLVYGGDQLLARGAVVAGTLYLVGSVVLGTACARAGYLIARRLSARSTVRGWARRGTAWPARNRASSGTPRVARTFAPAAIRVRTVSSHSPPGTAPHQGSASVTREKATGSAPPGHAFSDTTPIS